MGGLRDIAALVHDEWSYTGSWSVGAEQLENNLSPDQVVWVTAAATHEQPEEIGPHDANDGTGDLERQAITRRLAVDVHVWASDSDTAEERVEGLIGAAYTALRGSVQFVGETWPKQMTWERLKRGEPVIVRMHVDRPVAASGSRLQTVEIESANKPDPAELRDSLP